MIFIATELLLPETPGLKWSITVISSEGREDGFSSALLFLTISCTSNPMKMPRKRLGIEAACSAVIFNIRFSLGIHDLL